MPLTHEQRLQALTRAREARSRATHTGKAPLRRDFDEDPLWTDLARKRGIRLPNWDTPPTKSRQRTWLHKLSLSQPEYETPTGEKLGTFEAMNPGWPMRAWAGCALEMLEVS